MVRRGPSAFRSQPDTTARGREAERAGVEWLRRQGYRILARNVRTPAGEIDCIALDPRAPQGRTLCFVEIKARLDTRFGRAVESVDRAKQLRIARAASWYLGNRPDWSGPCRFDVLGLEDEAGEWRFELLRNAFESPPRAGSRGS